MELTVANYKLPLKKTTFGYLGTLSFTKDGTKVQCHICGELVEQLAWHARRAHSLTPEQYRNAFDLAKGTSLISEDLRKRLAINGMNRWNSMTKQERATFTKPRSHENHYKGASLETKNKRGHCPDQLLQKIKDFKIERGRVPSLREFRLEMNRKRNGGVVAMIYNTFGSWNTALKLAKLKINAPTQKRYSDDVLLKSLKVFFDVHQKIPTKSDAARGLIPDIGAYRNHFGGIVRARKLAGLPYFHPQRRSIMSSH